MSIRYVTKHDNWIVKSAFKPTSVKAPSTIMNHAGLMLGLAVNQRWCCEALTRDYSRGICNSPQSQQSEINWIFSTSARETGMFCPQVGFVKWGGSWKQDRLQQLLGEAWWEYWGDEPTHQGLQQSGSWSGNKSSGWPSNGGLNRVPAEWEWRRTGGIMSRVPMMGIKMWWMEARGPFVMALGMD